MIKKHFKNNHGYTLIELAAVMLIVGIIIASGFAAYEIYKKDQAIKWTDAAKVRIVFALNSYRDRYGRYPCPASYTAQRGTAEYGRSGDCSDTSVAPGQCDQGICVEQSIAGRTVTLEDGSVVNPRVRRGAIPYRALNLTEDEFYDQYGGRFSYAVTELLTDEDTFDLGYGGIQIVDGQLPTPQSLTDPPGSALYFLYSHGEDNVGAYGRNGVLLAECNGPMFDVENCNTSNVDNTAVYRYAQRSDVPIETGGIVIPGMPPPPVGVNVNRHYDDFAYYKGADDIPLFKLSETSPDDAYDLRTSDEAGRTIGLVIGNTVDDEMVNVEGTVAASETYDTTELCNQDGTDCFRSELLGGSGMHCATGRVATGVANSALGCAPPEDIDLDCEDGYVSGFQNGVPICDEITAPLPCAPRNVTVCGTRNTLAGSVHNTRITLTGGVSQVQIWRCNSGTWVRQSLTGVCTCTPGTVVTRGSCGAGYNGQTTDTTTTVCPSGSQSTRVDRSQCACAPGTETQSRVCPAGQSGTITSTRTTTCRGNVATVSQWRDTGNNCVCIAQAPQTRTSECPTGQTGEVFERRTWNNGGCSWNAWTEVSRNCRCQARTETRAVACPAGQIGTISEQRNVPCTGAPSAWTQVGNNCRVAPEPASCSWSKNGASMTAGTGGVRVGQSCECGSPTRNCRETTPYGVQGYSGCQCL